MGLAWQQGPLATRSVGQFLVADPLPERQWVVESEDVVLLRDHVAGPGRLRLAIDGQTFCPYRGLASYSDIGQNNRPAWCYVEAWPEVARVSRIATWSVRTNGT